MVEKSGKGKGKEQNAKLVQKKYFFQKMRKRFSGGGERTEQKAGNSSEPPLSTHQPTLRLFNNIIFIFIGDYRYYFKVSPSAIKEYY